VRSDALGHRNITEATADRSVRIPLTGGLCSLMRGFFAGTGSVTGTGGGETPLVLLI
jgi:hypothetical protein